MFSYIIRRLLLMFPTLVGIVTISFIVVQFVPGGPIDQVKSLLRGHAGVLGEAGGAALDNRSLKAQEIDPRHMEQLKKIYHLDRPLWERYLRTFIWYEPENPEAPFTERFFTHANWDGFLVFQFGDSFYRNKSVLELIKEKLPVSASLGVISFFVSYIVCIMLGIAKAVKNGQAFDTWTSLVVLIGYSTPGFVLGIFLIVFFGPGDSAIMHLIPSGKLTSSDVPGYADWSFWEKLIDYLHHLAAPLLCFMVGSFATLTILTKNSIIEEMRKQYVTTARAKGCTEQRVLYKHILKNALIPLITGFPIGFLAMFFTGSLLIEQIFTLDGLGRLSYEAVIQRDYPIVLGTLFIFSLLALVGQLLTDISYVIIDRRITFEDTQG
ncbi:putative ABC-type oligopeptide/dipeptide transport system, permease component [Nitrospina gracilis 3/211]|uniref:Putative ABC-type oligopeptide/dipeptide transport system, permease component n=1 Tax=Nitrospina gracilis (strain 3/211) TaxID=1266370 RepID=M1Z0Y1_NITG3|nr:MULTISPECIES: ABC transporter permease subunit [Nitrospina]MCF8724243.1 microcin C transport system permease protein [Nitrospina sp. Nb-3]CCQ91391.1 putative ABC-type oligopeptide/dipeptide transport system, permease component [Nitrospina gracilis 3/211]